MTVVKNIELTSPGMCDPGCDRLGHYLYLFLFPDLKEPLHILHVRENFTSQGLISLIQEKNVSSYDCVIV